MAQCGLFLRRAQTRNIQFKLSKSQFGARIIKLLGFEVGNGLRRVDPAKAKALQDWPLPSSCDDIVSVLAPANYVKDFIPDFHVHSRALRPYVKKGARFFGALRRQ